MSAMIRRSAAFAVLGCVWVAAAGTPNVLPFQGRITDQNGVAISNGVRLVQFKIFDVPTGGGPVWAGELHRTTVNGGLVNVLLGSKTPFTGMDFDRQLYLEITIDINGDNAITAADPPMLPRQAILPVVFAKEAADSRKLNGSDWTPIFGTNNPNIPIPSSKLANASVPGGKIQPGTITSTQIAPQTVTSNQISPETITSNQIANGTIDLSNLARHVLEALNPPGSIIAFGGDTNHIPDGWLPCDGRPLSSGKYPRLYSMIATNWGVGVLFSTNDFNLPDLRGMFLRGSGTHATQDMAVGGKFTGGIVGTFQTDNYQGHWHNLATRNQNLFSAVPSAADYTLFEVTRENQYPTSGAFDSITDGTHGVPRTGSETKPASYSVLYIIKY